jgi:hypothetical protein
LPFIELTIKCQLETSMAETSKSTTKEKAAKTKKESHREQENRTTEMAMLLVNPHPGERCRAWLQIWTVVLNWSSASWRP